jgi:uncharacterized membrane protein
LAARESGAYRSVMAHKKTVTFAVTHMCVAFAVGWAMTGNAAIGGALALVEPLVNTVAYFLHEKIWERSHGAASSGEARAA